MNVPAMTAVPKVYEFGLQQLFSNRSCYWSLVISSSLSQGWIESDSVHVCSTKEKPLKI